jgi:hypothetical protein
MALKVRPCRSHDVPRPYALASLALLLAGCAPTFPPIAANVPGDPGFKDRIARAYPPGSEGARLAADLAAERFVLTSDPAARRVSATYRADNIPCASQVRVEWTEDRRGRIVEVQAQRLDCS